MPPPCAPAHVPACSASGLRAPGAPRRGRSARAGVAILDDHEIVDNFGTPPEHSEPAFQNLRAGALDAFYDYQGARALQRQDGARRPRRLRLRR